MDKPSAPWFGAAYYPEDWPDELIDEDIALMKQAGMNVMRFGEFAWSCMEPVEGRFDFAWLHRVIDKLAEHGIASMLGTPTACPPIWLAQKYPDMFIVSDRGQPATHGARRNACCNHEGYLDHCRRIVTAMAGEFGRDENVIGWQIDNELYPSGPRACCCPSCHARFHRHLARKFGTIENLNAVWRTNIFSQRYECFEQIPIPLPDVWHHPSLLMEWMLFQSDSYSAFCGMQADILRAAVIQPIGTDMMPRLGLSYEDTFRKLDVVQFNHYHNQQTLWGLPMWLSYCRAVKGRSFWNTETSTCWNGATTANGYRDKGYCRANTWMAYALGAEANLYWLWRAHGAGHELMHGSVISSQGRPMHTFGEVQNVAAGLARCGEFLNATAPVAQVAMHFTTWAWWLYEFQPVVNGFKYLQAIAERVHRPLMEAHVHVDPIDPALDLQPYRMVISAFLPTLEEADLRNRLLKWIEAGGTWVVGPLSDIRTIHGTKYAHAPYGVLEEWAGVRCRYELPGEGHDFRLQWADGAESNGSVWYDGLELHGAEALATYTEYPLAGLAAVARRQIGKGQIIVLGTMPVPSDLQRLILRLMSQAGIELSPPASPNVVLAPRMGGGMEGLCAVEYANQFASLTLPRPAIDLLTGHRHSGEVKVEPYGVMVLKYER